MSSRMSPRASHRRHQYAILTSSPGSFFRRLFRILVQNVSFRNRQMLLKGQKCRGNLPGWRQYGVDGVFSDMRIKEKGPSFHESWTSG